MTVSEARAALPSLLDQVEAGGEVTITRHGRPVAVVVRPNTLRHRRAEAHICAALDLQQALAAARSTARPAAGLSPERAEELVAEVRGGRSRR